MHADRHGYMLVGTDRVKKAERQAERQTDRQARRHIGQQTFRQVVMQNLDRHFNNVPDKYTVYYSGYIGDI